MKPQRRPPRHARPAGQGDVPLEHRTLRRSGDRIQMVPRPELVVAAQRLSTQNPPVLTTLDPLAPATGVATFTRVAP